MNKQSILFGLGGLVVGIALVWATATVAVNNNNTGVMNMMGMRTNQNVSSNQTMMNDDDMSMSQMTSSLRGKTGDDFDKAFINEMIEHHQGAIDMATLAKTSAKHDEIKKMADDIITAQTKEINQMKTWQNEWNYVGPMNSHNMMN